MDFKSLGENSPVHIVRKKPFLYEVGTLKSKNIPQLNNQVNPYLAQAFQQNMPQKFDIVVSVNGKDETVVGIPFNGEAVEYNNTYYCTSSDGAMQAIAGMMQFASTAKADVPYYDSILMNGEMYMERLNPQYAEGKRQARVISDMQNRQDEQDKKLDDVLAMMKQLLGNSTQDSKPAKK